MSLVVSSRNLILGRFLLLRCSFGGCWFTSLGVDGTGFIEWHGSLVRLGRLGLEEPSLSSPCTYTLSHSILTCKFGFYIQISQAHPELLHSTFRQKLLKKVVNPDPNANDLDQRFRDEEPRPRERQIIHSRHLSSEDSILPENSFVNSGFSLDFPRISPEMRTDRELLGPLSILDQSKDELFK